MNERELLQDLIVYKKRKKEIESDLKNVNETILQLEGQMIEHLEEQDQEATAKYEGLGYCQMIKPRVFANYDKSREDEVFEWLENQGLDGVICQTVNKNTLSSLVRERLELGLDLPECIKYFLKPQIRLY